MKKKTKRVYDRSKVTRKYGKRPELIRTKKRPRGVIEGAKTKIYKSIKAAETGASTKRKPDDKGVKKMFRKAGRVGGRRIT